MGCEVVEFQDFSLQQVALNLRERMLLIKYVQVNPSNVCRKTYGCAMEIEFSGELALSASETTAGTLVIASKANKDQVDLLLVQLVEFSSKTTNYLGKLAKSLEGLHPLDAIELRSNFSSEWGSIMTRHVIAIHDHQNRDDTDVIAYTAWRYATLTAWGEASAARELSLELKIPVRTVQNRIRIARDKGLLPSPGTGARFGR
jgi:hypothetical protein